MKHRSLNPELLRRFLIFLFLALPAASYSQADFKVIRGKILNAVDGQPLPFCSVFIKGKSAGTISNQSGEFTFNVPADCLNDSLVVSHVGYSNFKEIVRNLPNELEIELMEATLNLNEIDIEAKGLTAKEILDLAVEKIERGDGYPVSQFRLDGFYRELHTKENQRTGIVECAVEIFDESVSGDLEEIVISQFRKIYEQGNKEGFSEWTAGKNHLLLLLNGGINFVPLSSQLKRTIWGKKAYEIEKITFYNDHLVYVISNESEAGVLKLLIDLDNFSVYKSELIIEAAEVDHKNYTWAEVGANGEKCGAILDHQSYEYREVNGKMYPYYFFRKQDFRCFDLAKQAITSQSYFSKELLINSVVTENFPRASPDKLKLQKGIITMNEPYDPAFWQHFNDIKDVLSDHDLVTDQMMTNGHKNQEKHAPPTNKPQKERQILKIGNHSLNQFTKADTLFGALTQLISDYDVGYYHLDIDVDVVKERIKGHSEITFRMINPADRIRIDLFEHLQLNSIVYNGAELKFSRDLDAVYVDFGKLLEKGTIHSIKVNYEGSPLDIDFENWAGAFLWQTDEYGNPWVQSICQGYGAKGWWPVKNHLSDEPDSSSVSVTVPAGLFAISNGNLTGIDTLNGGLRRFHWKSNSLINTYNIAVHIGDYSQISDSLPGVGGVNVPLTYYFLKNDRDFAVKKLSKVPDILKVYEKYFGAYPFPEDGFKIVQSPYPMEHQSCVAVGQFFEERLILHETAHEWWGNNVSCADNADIWIHEAFATYSESLYVEATIGYDIAQEYINSRRADISNDFPLLGVRGVNHFHYPIEDKYFKGALMLNTLRHVVDNDILWFDMLKSIQNEFRRSTIDTDVLLGFLAVKLGSSYSSFFNQYLRTTQIPILKIKRSDSNSFEYRWEKTVEDFDMPIKGLTEEILTPSGSWQNSEFVFPEATAISLAEKRYLIKVVLEWHSPQLLVPDAACLSGITHPHKQKKPEPSPRFF